MQARSVAHRLPSPPQRQPAATKPAAATSSANGWQPLWRNPMAMAAVALVHGVAVWLLVHAFVSDAHPLARRPLSVQVVIGNGLPTPAPVPHLPPVPRAALARPMVPTPEVPVPELPTPAVDAPTAQPPQWVDAARPSAPAASAEPTPPMAAALPTPKPVAASALRYRIEPAIAVPPLSRRLNESGQVLLRVVFDVTGAPVQVDLAKSSGFARLDEVFKAVFSGE